MKPLATALVLVFLPAAASAHGLSVRVELVGPAVAATVTFDDDEPADDCVVTVTTRDGTVVAKGPTDKAGLFTFPRPGPGTFTVTADAGAGHLATQTLTVAVGGESQPAGAEPETPRRKKSLSVWLALGAVGITVGSVILKKRARNA
jgi:hypothetical protein